MRSTCLPAAGSPQLTTWKFGAFGWSPEAFMPQSEEPRGDTVYGSVLRALTPRRERLGCAPTPGTHYQRVLTTRRRSSAPETALLKSEKNHEDPSPVRSPR